MTRVYIHNTLLINKVANYRPYMLQYMYIGSCQIFLDRFMNNYEPRGRYAIAWLCVKKMDGYMAYQPHNPSPPPHPPSFTEGPGKISMQHEMALSYSTRGSLDTPPSEDSAPVYLLDTPLLISSGRWGKNISDCNVSSHNCVFSVSSFSRGNTYRSTQKSMRVTRWVNNIEQLLQVEIILTLWEMNFDKPFLQTWVHIVRGVYLQIILQPPSCVRSMEYISKLLLLLDFLPR